MITRRTSVLSLVAVLLAMLLGMANPVLASPPGATPVDPPTEAANSGQKDGVSNLAAEQQPRMLKDGSREMTAAEIAHDDKLWETFRWRLDTFDGTVAKYACEPGPAQDLVAQILADTPDPTVEEIEAAWEEVYYHWYVAPWESWINMVKYEYLDLKDRSYGSPPAWVPLDLVLGRYILVRMDPSYPGCSTGAYSAGQ